MASFHVLAGHGEVAIAPVIRKIGWSDLKNSLKLGVDDFREMPSHLVFLSLIYPICGIVLAYMTTQSNALQLVFPLASGFALIGPFAAIGLYEMSRRREEGITLAARDVVAIVHAPAFGAILVLGALLVAIFLLWLIAAQMIYISTLGPEPPASIAGFAHDVLATHAGWA